MLVPQQADIAINDTVTGWGQTPGTPVISGLTEDRLGLCAGERLLLGVDPGAVLYYGVGTGFPYIVRGGYISIQAQTCDSWVAIKDLGLPTEEIWLRGTHRQRNITSGRVRAYETRYHEANAQPPLGPTETMEVGESFGGVISDPIVINSFSVFLDFGRNP